ncbi:MAG: hypothetical protein ACR2QA_18550 [Solirubrobacteraceae bacterium]
MAQTLRSSAGSWMTSTASSAIRRPARAHWPSASERSSRPATPASGTGDEDVAARALYESLGFSNREGKPEGPVNYFYEREL